MKKYLYILPCLFLMACSEDDLTLSNSGNDIVTAYTPAKNNFYNEILAQGQFNQTKNFTELGFFISDDSAFKPGDNARKIISKYKKDGYFQEWIDQLEPDTYYYLCSYGQIGNKIIYGDRVRIKTSNNKIDYASLDHHSIPSEVIDGRTVKLSGVINSAGNDPEGIKEYGAYVWLSDINPEEAPNEVKKISFTTEDKNEIKEGSSFDVNISGLKPDSDYSYLLYARNNRKEQYVNGENQILTVKTFSLTTPQVETLTMKHVSTTQMTAQAKIIDNGQDPERVIGFYFGTTLPLTEKFIVEEPLAGIDQVFSFDKSGLTKLTDYYVQAFIINEKEEARGEIVSFTTLDSSTPIFEVSFPSYDEIIKSFTENAVKLKAQIVSDGGETIDECGAYWGVNPDELNNKTIGKISELNPNEIEVNIEGLEANTIYYYRIYGLNKLGESQTSLESVATKLKIGKWVNNGSGSFDAPNKFISLSRTDFDFYYELPPLTVTEKDGKTYRYYFLDRNLGASKVCSDYITQKDIEAIGNQYVFGWAKPGAVPSTGIAAQAGFGWIGNTLGTGLTWKENPAPQGYQIPTIEEWRNVIAVLGEPTIRGTYELLKIGPTGIRNAVGGPLANTNIVTLFAGDTDYETGGRPLFQADMTRAVAGNTQTGTVIQNVIQNGGSAVRCFRKILISNDLYSE